MPMNMGGIPGPHNNNGMAPGVNGGGMPHGIPPVQPNGQMTQMQGMRYDPRNDNSQYAHGMHPYGPMSNL